MQKCFGAGEEEEDELLNMDVNTLCFKLEINSALKVFHVYGHSCVDDRLCHIWFLSMQYLSHTSQMGKKNLAFAFFLTFFFWSDFQGFQSFFFNVHKYKNR